MIRDRGLFGVIFLARKDAEALRGKTCGFVPLRELLSAAICLNSNFWN